MNNLNVISAPVPTNSTSNIAIASSSFSHLLKIKEEEDKEFLEKPNIECINRIKREIVNIFQEPIPLICVLPDQSDVTKIDALIIGPPDTPYQDGFFHFKLQFPSNYPFRPPRVKFLTTSNEKVRFNPNLYNCGKVCLSILGTWVGPGWLPSQSLSSVLISIQSLLSSKPYHNEPGLEKAERTKGASDSYNQYILHQTLKVAVCENLEKENYEPEQFRKLMIKSFLAYNDYYEKRCLENISKDGSELIDTLTMRNCGKYEFGSILARLRALKEKLSKFEEELSDEDEDDDDDDDQEMEE